MLKHFVLATFVWCNMNLYAQTVPTIVTQPMSQTNLAGSTASFSVAVDGTGPFIYQWQFKGTNFPNIITTVAGSGTYGFSGDGGLATNASLAAPQGVAFDAAGNMLIADNDNERIRMVDSNGIINTIAGNGAGAHTGNGTYSGDGGAATNAGLNQPNNITFDATGNWYIADIFNSRIRKVDTNGVITTVAGNGMTFGSYRGTYSGDGGAATNAGLFCPANVAFDAIGNMYIADLFNNRVRKVDTNGIITTVAGNGNAVYSGDGGMATNASLDYLQGVASDEAGNIYIADTRNYRIRKMDTNGIINTVAGRNAPSFAGDGGTATNAYLASPWFTALDSIGEIYIADRDNHRIRKVDTKGIITTVAGNGSTIFGGDGGIATKASLNIPACVAFDSVGNLHIADWGHNRIRQVRLSGCATSASTNVFILSNVAIANAGNYTVVITSQYGSITSSPAKLTVIIPSTPPQIITSGTNFGFTTNQSGFGFNLSGAFGQTIVVDSSTNLLNWTPLYTNTAGTNAAYFIDPNSTNYVGRFYRARLQ